ncbi:phosphatidylglycerol lysyltransferase domain-containing protein [Paenibacillus sp. 2KB_22]|uniref:phosphatidylglycerol lysyltransferase domain-containing protein n=1 Tax=Paenibacillus sp. 2KB_22 TaxID=3232978 RepID=UPI003F968710
MPVNPSFLDSPSFLQRFPIAMLRDAEGKILAFATLAPGYDHNRLISIDLMRQLNETPNGTMDVLFVNLIKWAKKKGYSYFNLGMSPLSRVGENSNAHCEEKFVRLVFQYVSFHHGGIDCSCIPEQNGLFSNINCIM